MTILHPFITFTHSSSRLLQRIGENFLESINWTGQTHCTHSENGRWSPIFCHKNVTRPTPQSGGRSMLKCLANVRGRKPQRIQGLGHMSRGSTGQLLSAKSILLFFATPIRYLLRNPEHTPKHSNQKCLCL